MARDNIFSRFGGGLARFGEALSGAPLPLLEQQREEERRRQLGNILSGQSIPAFARPGGAEPSTPEQIRNVQLGQLGQVGSPGATNLLAQIAPIAQRPVTDLERREREADISATKALAQGRAAGGRLSAVERIAASIQEADPSIDRITAISIAKQGLGQGVTLREGQVTPIGGTLETRKKLAESREEGRLAAQLELEPSVASAVATAREVGKERGVAKAELESRIAGHPNLVKVAEKLSRLGKKATFTKAGQARDIARRELGLDIGPAGVARAEFVATIDNEILPLLRQTFGAQFTEGEGRALKATLGDVDKSPAEKDAILKAFIASKQAQIETLQRQVTPQAGGIRFLGFE